MFRTDERKNMKTVITVVVDNISDNDLTGEWGLCLYIEYGDKKILTDAGSSDLFLKNLEKNFVYILKFFCIQL